MASAGPNICGTGADDSGNGTTAWSNPGNITANDASNASVTLSPYQASHWLKATNLGFAIPADATVGGITVELWASASSNAAIADTSARIVKGGVVVGASKSSGISTLSIAGDLWTYGGASDLWGVSWLGSDINAADFGFVWAVTNSSVGAETAYVDYIRITVEYTVGDFDPQVVSSIQEIVIRGAPRWRAHSRALDHFPDTVTETPDNEPSVVRSVPRRYPFIVARSRVFGAADDFVEESTPEWYSSVIHARSIGHVAPRRRSHAVLLAAPEGQASVCCCPFGAIVVARRFATASIVAVDVTPRPITFSSATIVQSTFATAILIENNCAC